MRKPCKYCPSKKCNGCPVKQSSTITPTEWLETLPRPKKTDTSKLIKVDLGPNAGRDYKKGLFDD